MMIGAIDGGGTKVLTAVMTDKGKIIARCQRSVPTTDIPAYFNQCAKMLSSCTWKAGIKVTELKGVGMNIPGMVTASGGVLGSPSAGWGAFEARPLLMAALGIAREKLFFENDINACALAEQRFGGAERDFVWITISTGNGGAVVVDGKLARGTNGCAGEFGHLKVERQNPFPCQCGEFGCLEAHASGVAIARRATEAGLGADIDAERCEELARQGNAAAQSVYEEAGVYLGRALAIAANLLNPSCAYIGGGVAPALDLMMASIRKTFDYEALPQCRMMKIEKTHLGYDAALLGAAAVCLDGLQL